MGDDISVAGEAVYEIAEPCPSAMIESLRAVGYSLSTAIADLVDNSISALAKNVWINFNWNGGDSCVTIADDGHGMTEQELVTAMTLGSKSPVESRSAHDLGRFGLGLKTASFSQCRRLVVSSKRCGEATALRCWDLDYVSQQGEWRLLKEMNLKNQKSLTSIDHVAAGTVVVWEKVDRIVSAGVRADDRRAQKRFLEAIGEVEKHLSMVFHRFLAGRDRLEIWINGRLIEAWDPFLKGEIATQSLPEETLQLGSGAVKVSAFVLPHHSKIDDNTYRLAGGPAGWNAQQGFYVYRNERLLVAGHWLGFGFQKEEHYKLARIQVDISTTMDLEWEIDVKKSRARPPAEARESLRKIARLTRDIACGIYRSRGKVIARAISADFVFTWLRTVTHGKISYRINREHPLVKASLSGSAAEKAAVNAMLQLIEETVPKEQIWLDNQESVESRSDPFEDVDRKELLSVLAELFSFFSSSGMSAAEIRERLGSMEPFNHFPEAVNRFCDQRERNR